MRDAQQDPFDDRELQLAPSERVLWIGRPNPRRFRGEIWGELAFGFLLACVALAAATPLALGLWTVRDWKILLLLPVPGIFGWHAYHHLSAPFRYRASLHSTAYVVTDRQALVVDGFGMSQRMNLESCAALQTFPRPLVGQATSFRRRRDGTVDVVFAGERRGSGRYYSRYVEFGFFGVDDGAALAAALSGYKLPQSPTEIP